MNRIVGVLLVFSPFCCTAQKFIEEDIINKISTCWEPIGNYVEQDTRWSPQQIKQFKTQRVCIDNHEIDEFFDTLYSLSFEVKKQALSELQWQKKYIGTKEDSLFQITISGNCYSRSTRNWFETTSFVYYDGKYLFIMDEGMAVRYREIKNVKRTPK